MVLEPFASLVMGFQTIKLLISLLILLAIVYNFSKNVRDGASLSYFSFLKPYSIISSSIPKRFVFNLSTQATFRFYRTFCEAIVLLVVVSIVWLRFCPRSSRFMISGRAWIGCWRLLALYKVICIDILL